MGSRFIVVFRVYKVSLTKLKSHAGAGARDWGSLTAAERMTVVLTLARLACDSGSARTQLADEDAARKEDRKQLDELRKQARKWVPLDDTPSFNAPLPLLGLCASVVRPSKRDMKVEIYPPGLLSLRCKDLGFRVQSELHRRFNSF